MHISTVLSLCMLFLALSGNLKKLCCYGDTALHILVFPFLLQLLFSSFQIRMSPQIRINPVLLLLPLYFLLFIRDAQKLFSHLPFILLLFGIPLALFAQKGQLLGFCTGLSLLFLYREELFFRLFTAGLLPLFACFFHAFFQILRGEYTEFILGQSLMDAQILSLVFCLFLFRLEKARPKSGQEI